METAFDVMIRHSYINSIFNINHVALQRCVCKEWFDTLKHNSRDDVYLLKSHLDKNLLQLECFDKSTDINIYSFLKLLITIRKNFDNDEKLKCLLDKENVRNIFVGINNQVNTIKCITSIYEELNKSEPQFIPYIAYILYVYMNNIVHSTPEDLKTSSVFAHCSFNRVCCEKANLFCIIFRHHPNYKCPPEICKIVIKMISDTKVLIQDITKSIEMQSSGN
jgi:hypothetical protein